MRDIGVQVEPMSVVEVQLCLVSLLLHNNNHIYTTINPGPVYSLVRAPSCDGARGVFWDGG